MESYRIEHVTFTYPNTASPALSDVSLIIPQGQFVVLCGKSGCGKSTLLRQLKPALSPHGAREGKIWFGGKPLSELGRREQSAQIGFVLQSPDNQIVTDKVWHELAFGLESLGYSTPEIRARVAEMASFFGIQTWFHKKVSELSGGQKQLLNLAAIMAMQPSVLLLDEPTSQLDPIAAQDFLDTLQKINRELGTTILLTEHRLEEALPLCDRMVVMDGGRIIADGTPRQAAKRLWELGHDMCAALPTPMRVSAAVSDKEACPVTVREGRAWLEEFSKHTVLNETAIPADTATSAGDVVLKLQDVWFRYARELPDVVKGLSLTVRRGELYAIVGGNGTGKTTTLSLLGGLLTPYRGTAAVGEARVAMLPQNPQALFVKKTVELDLYEMLSDKKLDRAQMAAQVRAVADICQLDGLLERHPYDLSGGEQQRAALAKVLLTEPDILLLDEPTKGLDAHFKQRFAGILRRLQQDGVTVVMVSHDVEFCAQYADRCGMFFDGKLVSEDCPRAFFAGKSFYTTAANRMARGILPAAVLADDIIAACGGRAEQPDVEVRAAAKPAEVRQEKRPEAAVWRITGRNVVWGGIFGLAFLLTLYFFYGTYDGWRDYAVQLVTLLELTLCAAQWIPRRQLDRPSAKVPREKRRISKRTLVAAGVVLLAAPLTIFVGMYYLGDRKYYFISLLLLLEVLAPFALLFEDSRPQARELVVISVLCALTVAGRVAFFMLPQFKPVVALVIIAGVCFGGETGFLVGAVSALVSNFFFGQGPFTPWQMVAFGSIGFLAGVLFRKGILRKTRGSLMVFGGLATVLIYGGMMNPAAVLMQQSNPTAMMFLAGYAVGLPMDLIHAASTMCFLWVLSGPMIEKLDRIKIKYGLLER